MSEIGHPCAKMGKQLEYIMSNQLLPLHLQLADSIGLILSLIATILYCRELPTFLNTTLRDNINEQSSEPGCYTDMK